MSNLAKVNMSGAVEASNEKHMGPWSEMCQEAGISNTPLTPYLDKVRRILRFRTDQR